MSKQSDLLNLTDAISVSGTNVGIGTSSPSFATASGSATGLEIAGTVPALNLNAGSSDEFLIYGGSSNANILVANNNPLRIITGGSESLRIDSSGNLLVGMTSNGITSTGIGLVRDGTSHMYSGGTHTLELGRGGSDGDILKFNRSGTTVGSIGSQGTSLYIQADGDRAGLTFGGADVVPRKNNANSDNVVDLGHPSYRFKVVYAGTGSINTSDRNEKQDIDVMFEAETRVAVACKGLMRKFRFIDAVEAKGDDARIHFGIIAQDLQDAFAAEGLDASRYAMFCSNTWWETQTDVPAVEAVVEVLDEEGNVVTEAVEAKEAYIRTDHYDTLEKAPEGATERTRLGVRYSELLAFIIGAL
jgi:hypothetical protein